MKKFIFVICVIYIFFLGCKLAKEPSATPYKTIEDSKKNNAFIAELRPQQSFIEIEGNKYFIKAAWIEHPHNSTNWGDIIGDKIFCYVMEMEYYPNLKIDFKEYISELGNGPTEVWSFLTKGREKNNYIELHYRSSLKQANKDKVFLLYKK